MSDLCVSDVDVSEGTLTAEDASGLLNRRRELRRLLDPHRSPQLSPRRRSATNATLRDIEARLAEHYERRIRQITRRLSYETQPHMAERLRARRLKCVHHLAEHRAGAGGEALPDEELWS